MKYLLIFLLTFNVFAQDSLRGKDSDSNGIRDDVDKWLMEHMKDYTKSGNFLQACGYKDESEKKKKENKD